MSRLQPHGLPNSHAPLRRGSFFGITKTRATHRYEPPREAAMAALAKSWRRE